MSNKGKACPYIKPPNLYLCQENSCATCETYRKKKEGEERKGQ